MQLKQEYPEWQPNAVVDIGANAGRWAHEVRANYKNTKILMLEATPNHEEALQKKCNELGNAEYQIALLGGTSGEKVDFYQLNDCTGNSMFVEKTHAYDSVKPVTRTTITLDDAVKNSTLRNEEYIDFIKADVQGAELLVLSGGEETIARAAFIQLEASTVEYNEGGACFYEMDALMRSKGFYWYEISDMFRHTDAFKTHGLGQFDVLYVNPLSPRLPEAFRKLNGNYCGMNKKEPSSTTISSSLPLEQQGLTDSGAVTEDNVARGLSDLHALLEEVALSKGNRVSVLTILPMLVLAFLAGVHYGTLKAKKSLMEAWSLGKALR